MTTREVRILAANVRDLTDVVFKRMNPVVAHLLAECEREGRDEMEVYLALTTAALVIAATSHAGSEELFLKMAQLALESADEDGPAVH
jgi:hypothetical protein